MTADDIIDREIGRLEGYIEDRKLPFLHHVSRSRPALLIIAVMVLVFQMRNLPETWANNSLDAAISIQRPVPARSVRLMTIDDNDYKDLFQSRSPLDSKVLGEILAAVAKGHPSAIVVDIDTSDPTFSNMAIPPVPIVWNVAAEQKEDGKFVLYPPLGGSPLPAGSVAALAVAPQDERGVVRGYQQMYPLESGGMVDAPGFAAARILGHIEQGAAKRGTETHFLDFRYRFAPMKAHDLMENAKSDTWAEMAPFRGQVVVLGGTYHVARDQYATPRGLLNGCEIVAQSVAAEIDHTSISSASRWMTGLMMIIGGLTTLAVYHWFRFRLAFLISLALIPALSLASNWILFHRLAAWGSMVPLVIAVIVAELYSKAALYAGFYQRVAVLKTIPSPPKDSAPIPAPHA
jgi:CHASE2 domain-containing sensor protein